MNKSDVEDLYELSPMQQGMLFHCLHDPGNKGLYVIQLSYALHGALNVPAFEQAWQMVVSRHAILRTFFTWQDLAKPLQVVVREIKLPLENQDWRELSPAEQQQRLAAFLKEDHKRGFDFAKPPLIRLMLIRRGENLFQFVWTFHHMLFEGWSAAIIVKELSAFYQALSRGQNIDLERPRPYRDYIIWQQQQDISNAEAYWRKKLAGFTVPTSLQIGGLQGERRADAAEYATERIRLPVGTSGNLNDFAREHRLTLNTVALGSWSLLLSRYSGAEDIVFGIALSGRPPDLVGSEGMVGLFVNTLPMRVQVGPEESVLAWLQTLQSQLVELRQYEYTPLIEVQGWSPGRRGLPLFESILAFENWAGDLSFRGLSEELEMRDFQHVEGGTGYPLTITVNPRAEFEITIRYNTARFDHGTIRSMLGHFQKVLEGIVANARRSVSELSLLTEAERHQLLVEWNDTDRDYPREKCIHELFEAQVERTPDAVAVAFEDQQLTYWELNCRANQLAHYLRKQGVGPEVLVGICVERSPEMVVGVLGILKAGGAYVPLDPAYPKERIAFMLEDSRVAVLLTRRKLLSRLDEIQNPKSKIQNRIVVCIDREGEEIARESTENPASGVLPDNLAYVIYTSGSTGKPKGVTIQHNSAVTLMHWAHEIFPQEDIAGMLASTSICFDLSVFELFFPLSWGGRVILVENVLQLSTRAEANSVTLINTVPSAVAELLRADSIPPSVRTVCLAGEPLTTRLVQRIYRQKTIQKVFDLYGPSEDTTYSTFVLRDPAGPATVGRPIANTQIYIVDSHLRPVPVGVPGELYLGGMGLARGYRGYPDQTAEKFVSDPFSGEPGARVYRTGDLARYLPDGNIEFLGRIDHQVKVRGFRIELGEIETVLSQHPAVRENVVTAREDKSGDKRLVAYIVPRQEPSPNVGELRSFLKDKLPEYMVPSALVMLDALPLTPNGKVDRQALPAPDGTRPELKEKLVRPRNTTEERLERIWAKLLGVRQVGIYDNFFDLGGHSLLAVRLFAEIEKEFKRPLPISSLFEEATIEHLASLVSQSTLPNDSPSLVGIQPRGSKRPFFCIHEFFGDVFCYRNLAHHLGDEQPFYALQARGLNGSEEPFTDLEAMAAYYIEQIRTVQPHGPYALGGLCSGGVVAFEMARQLRAMGEIVEVVALLDSGIRLEQSKMNAWGCFLTFLKDFPSWLIGSLQLQRAQWVTLVKMKLRGRVRLDASDRDDAPKFIKELGDLLGFSEQHRRVAEGQYRALRQYRPGIYLGRLTLFRARMQPFFSAHAPDNGWGDLAAGGLDICVVPGNHLGMLQEPHVRVLAEQLRACLDGAQKRLEAKKRLSPI